MKEADDIAGRTMPSSNVRAFMPVAVEARKREIVRGVSTTMLACNDVVDAATDRDSQLSAEQRKPGLGLDHCEQVTHM
jgi:hypothetical protein